MGQPVALHRRTRSASSPRTRPGTRPMAWLVAPYRRLEILTIVKRRDALGHARARRRGGRLHPLAHRDARTSSRSRWAASAPRRSSSATSRPVPAATCSTPPTWRPRWSAPRGMTDTLISYGAVQSSAFNDTNLVGRVLADPDGPRRGRGPPPAAEGAWPAALLDGQPAPGRGAARRAARAPRAGRAGRSPTCSRPPGTPTAASPRSPRGRPEAELARGHRPSGRPGVGCAARVNVGATGASDPADDCPWRPRLTDLDAPATGEAVEVVPEAVVVRFGGARYAVPMADVAEVVPVPRVTRVPGTPTWLAGVVNWRGRVLPVVDLRPIIGDPLSPAAQQRPAPRPHQRRHRGGPASSRP